jgi:hypothetical protein
MRFKRLIASKAVKRLLLALLVSPVVLVAIPPSPAFAAGCWSYSCVGYAPARYGCSWDTSVTGYAHNASGTTIANVWNWYSNNCHTNWAAASLTAAGLAAGDSLRVWAMTSDTRGNFEYMCGPGPSNIGANEPCQGFYSGPYLLWTDMVEGTNVAVAKLTVFDRSGVAVDGIDVDQ